MELSKEHKISVVLFVCFIWQMCIINQWRKDSHSTNAVGEIGYPWDKKQKQANKQKNLKKLRPHTYKKIHSN